MKNYCLGDLISIKHGFAFDGDHISQNDNGIVLVTPGNFQIGGGFQEEKCKFFSGNIPTDYILKPDSFIVTMTDLSKTIDTLGYSALIPHSNRIYLHNQRIGLVTLKNDECDRGYLYWLMRTHSYQRSIANSSTGSTVHHTSPSKIYDFRFKAPCFEKQREIAHILFSYEYLIENNQKQIKLLEEAAQRLYKEWFVDLRFPGWENTKIVDGVPEGWEKTTISSVSSVLRRGISPKYNDNATFTVINQKCIRQTIVDFSESRKQEKTFSSEMALIDSDTVICSTGAGTLGRVGQIFGSPTNATFDSHVTLVRTNGRIGAQLLFQSLKDQQTYLQDSGKGSTNQLELSRTIIAECPVFIPSESVSKHFEALVQPIHDLISKISQSVLLLQNSKDMMLSKLINENTEEHHAS